MRHRVRRGTAAIAAVLAVAPVLSAQAGDLIAHNGFAECWDASITKAMFFAAAEASLEGTTGCVSPQTGGGYGVCESNGCTGGQPGCQVTLHVGSGTAGGSFDTGAFTDVGVADPISVPVSVGGSPFCTMILTGIQLNYSWTNTLQADGNNGKYSAALAGNAVTIPSYTVAGNCNSTINGLLSGAAKTRAEQAASAAVSTELAAATVGESVCPLTP